MSVPFEKEDALSEFFITASRVSELAARGIRRALKDAPQCHFEILERIFCLMKAQENNELAVSDLVKYTALSPQAVSRLLRGLEKEELILRKPDTADRRRTIIKITEKGEELRSINRDISVEYLRDVVREFGVDNLKKMNELNLRLQEALERIEADRERPREKQVKYQEKQG